MAAEEAAVTVEAFKAEEGCTTTGTETEEGSTTAGTETEKCSTAGDALAAAAGSGREVEVDSIDDEEWVPGSTVRLPKQYVDWILRREKAVLEEDPDDYYNRMINDPDRPEVYTQEFLEKDREIMREMAGLFERVWARFEKFQSWVRSEFEEKGYVEVGEAYLAARARVRRSVTVEQWNAMLRDIKLDDLKLLDDN